MAFLHEESDAHQYRQMLTSDSDQQVAVAISQESDSQISDSPFIYSTPTLLNTPLVIQLDQDPAYLDELHKHMNELEIQLAFCDENNNSQDVLERNQSGVVASEYITKDGKKEIIYKSLDEIQQEGRNNKKRKLPADTSPNSRKIIKLVTKMKQYFNVVNQILAKLNPSD